MLPLAIVIITAALVFYSIGVWAERIQRTLRWWHAGMFALGLAADTTGTLLMTQISAGRRADGIAETAAGTLMAFTGTAAIVLMAIHLIWAVIVLLRGRESEKRAFHRFSIVVWAIWLIPYVAGAISAMAG
ncbi:putative repeat protein (TIGR03987 family) [Microbacterium sp. AG790]|uniref:HsmA family protein n=1 Tax=Microbacterium sp. AG790 TaxID=2183995 RepID=UPI000EB566AB|nr:HsmA family protein [Microbacterium sp. AG790]RKS89306.1 putative repeat protein (TIGR03987 family) [Microbacterium sp. AG790]